MQDRAKSIVLLDRGSHVLGRKGDRECQASHPTGDVAHILPIIERSSVPEGDKPHPYRLPAAEFLCGKGALLRLLTCVAAIHWLKQQAAPPVAARCR